MFLKAFLGKISRLSLVGIGLLGGIFVYATIDRTEVSYQHLVIIPDIIESSVWQVTDKVLEQEASEFSLYQDFSPANSAYLKVGSDNLNLEPLIESSAGNTNSGNIENGNSPENYNVETENNTTNSSAEDEVNNNETNSFDESDEPYSETTSEESTEGGFGNNPTTSEPTEEPESAPAESEAEPEPISEPEANEEISIRFSFPLASQEFLLAQEVLTAFSTTTVLDEDIIDISDPSSEEELVSGETNEEENSEKLIDEDGEFEISDMIGEEESADNNPADVDADGGEVGGNLMTEEVVPDACTLDPNCEKYSMVLGGFLMPEFASGEFISSAQLRLSLAAKVLNQAKDQKFVVEYNYDRSDKWRTATVIEIDDEISNSLNGGYFLVSLEKPSSQADISNLRVRLSFQGDIEKLDNAFVEGVWLDVVSSTFFENNDMDGAGDQITYTRDLEEPAMHTLNNAGEDSALSHLPAFTLSYSPQTNFLGRVFNSVFSENIFKVDGVRLIDGNGEVVEVPFEIIYQTDTTWTVRFLGQPQKLVPGKYKLEIIVDENDKIFVDSFEFYWGVLAVNTSQSIYAPNDAVTLAMAALTDKGDTICDANLGLQVIDPDNNIFDLPVERSGFCGKNNVTDEPDYLADFTDTSKVGTYTIQLKHFNKNGEVVHRIKDSFEVREYTPFVIERSAPTRIYPPAPYSVTLHITANQDFKGDIIETVPRGFVVDDASGANLITEINHTQLVWKEVELKVGEELTLSYTFKAPNISPYMYLLGPLNMDGFKELRQWQIASDAIVSSAWLTGTETAAGDNLNSTVSSPLVWDESSYDKYFFTHSTSSESERLYVKQPGDYRLDLTLPLYRLSANSTPRIRVGAEVRVNGFVVEEGAARNGLIFTSSGNIGTKVNTSIVLKDLEEDDYIEIYTYGLSTVNPIYPVGVFGRAGLRMEYLPPNVGVFSATTVGTTNPVNNINDATPYPFTWTETRQDSGFVHSDSVNPENIIISNPGTYLVTVSVPFSNDGVAYRVSPRGTVLLDGNTVPGGVFNEGFQGVSNGTVDPHSSNYWSGIVVSTTSNQVLSIITEQGATAGTTTISDGLAGSLVIQKLPAEENIIILNTKNTTAGTEWSRNLHNGNRAWALWNTEVVKDTNVFTHSTSSNQDIITVDKSGSYLLMLNASFNFASNGYPVLAVEVDGVEVDNIPIYNNLSNTSYNLWDTSSSLLYELNLTAGQEVAISTHRSQSGGNGYVTSKEAATLMLWLREEVNERPDAPILSTPFNSIKTASTSPTFAFKTVDPDGTSDLEYQFSIADSADFSASTTYQSGINTVFKNVDTPADTNPFNNNELVELSLESGDELQNNTTYYWRVRARDVDGSNLWGEWSVTNSITIDTAQSVDSWFQTLNGQFEGNSNVGTISSGDNQLKVDSTPPQEVMFVYSEGTQTEPRYRLWDGSLWGLEYKAKSVGGIIKQTDVKANPTRNEYVLVNVTEDGRTVAQVYDGVAGNWDDDILLLNNFGSPAVQGTKVIFENQTGRALVLSCDGSNAVYSVWDGANWSATTSISLINSQDCLFVEAASDPTSNEIIAIFGHRRSGSILIGEALVWNGSSWTNGKTFGRNYSDTLPQFAVAYNKSGTQAVVVNTGSSMSYIVWDKENWTTEVSQAMVGGRIGWPILVTDPFTDNIGLCSTYTYTTGFIWNGGSWTNGTILDRPRSNGYRTAGCYYSNLPGQKGNFVIDYWSNRTMDFSTAIFNGTGWATSSNSVSAIPSTTWSEFARAGDGLSFAAFQRSTPSPRSIFVAGFNGVSWSSAEVFENVPTQISGSYTTKPFAFAPKNYQFSTGQTTSRPINFTDVAGQSTWGDINFNTTEPLGTEVSVRVKYSDVGVCDTYISDGVLPGNSAGFSVGQTPIDLTGLSTSTYSQLCVEGTFSTRADASASLDDWELSWERQPRLNQHNYRWFANSSTLTPNDAWPAGNKDLAEAEVITATDAVSVNDVLRLRLSLAGFSVTTPAFKRTFKLQYAQGMICSQDLVWNDVGEPDEATIWRGYHNSIVGEDWYSESWTRRVKVTVDHSWVAENLTDFPIYINLASLPAGFFSAVKSDGGDIRITKTDGVSEVPFDLVNIDTSAKTGELYVKGDLLTASDTSFYIYYGNAGASAYSVSSTYGRNKVWDNGYLAVYHLNTLTDSSGNNHNLSISGTLSNITGKIGNGMNMNGGGTLTTLSPISVSGDLTFQLWLNPSAWPGANPGVWRDGSSSSGSFFNIFQGASGRPWIRWNGSNVLQPGSGFSMSLGTMQSIAYVVKSADFARFYAQGELKHNANHSVATAPFSIYNFGWQFSAGEKVQGIYDEMRLSSSARSTGWLETEFNNQNSPNSFYGVSSEELISNGKLLPSTLLSDSDKVETYTEYSPTRENQSEIVVGENSEWDFVIQNNGANPNARYCFRVVYQDGAILNSYLKYPQLITNAPPLTPGLYRPFDNEKLAPVRPDFEFLADDELEDLVSYQVQIGNDPLFDSVVVDKDSAANFALFENLAEPAQRGEYTSGQRVRFTPDVDLNNGQTYYWRVRAKDAGGSGVFGSWSSVSSFTIDNATVITTWYQTKADQFDKNDNQDVEPNGAGDDLRLVEDATAGTTVSDIIDFQNRTTGNTWGQLSFNQNVSSGNIAYFVEYRKIDGQYERISDDDLPGNAAGFSTSPIELSGLDIVKYRYLRVGAALSGNSSLPRLLDWTVTWGEKMDAPELIQPFDNAKVNNQTPNFRLVATDPEADDIEYEIQVADNAQFNSAATYNSGVDAGFANTVDIGDTSPFTSGDTISFTNPTTLTEGVTYWWRARAKDPSGSGSWSEYTRPYSFTVDTSIETSVWYQTTNDQFMSNTTANILAKDGAAKVTTVVSGAMMVYGHSTELSPRYSLWNGTEWSEYGNAALTGGATRWVDVKAAPTRPEYALVSANANFNLYAQIFDQSTNQWGNLKTIRENFPSNRWQYRSFDLSYETISGKLMVVSCEDNDAVYSIWNGTSWTATTSLPLIKEAECAWVKLASSPVSNEIIAVFNQGTSGTPDFEMWVWNGSSWGNSAGVGQSAAINYEGVAVSYDSTGSKAMVVIPNNTATNVYFKTWNGSSWSSDTLQTVSKGVYWGNLAADPNSNQLAYCYRTRNTGGGADVGVMFYDGSSWSAYDTLSLAARSAAYKLVDCAFETTPGNEGKLMVAYADDTNALFALGTSTAAFTAPDTIGAIDTSYYMRLMRSGDGLMHVLYHQYNNPTRFFMYSRFDGNSWIPEETVSTVPAITISPHQGSFDMAAQVYPEVTNASLRTRPIKFGSGSGPRWERVTWNDDLNDRGEIAYRVYYESAPNTFSLVPDADLPGNSAGFTTSPLSIASLNRVTYHTLQLDAELTCVEGDCPSVLDWSLEWSEGLTVSGKAFDVDSTTTLATGTVGVAVNGVLQPTKLGTIGGDGSWSISNVTAFPDDIITVFIKGADADKKSVAVTKYDGVGDIGGLRLVRRNLTLGSETDNVTISNADIGQYDSSKDADIFFGVDSGTKELTLCTDVACADATLRTLSNVTYAPGAVSNLINFANYGIFSPTTNTTKVSAYWQQFGTFNVGQSTVVFTATSSTFIPQATSTTLNFYNVSFGETAGTAVWQLKKTLNVAGSLEILSGTLDRATSSIVIAGNLHLGNDGSVVGIGTTTFAGSGSKTWGDDKAATSSSNMGFVVVDGTAKTVTLSGNVGAETIYIGADDTLNSSNSGFNLNVRRGWVNNNAFVPQNGTVTFVGTSTGLISRGSSPFNNLSFTGIGGSWFFTTPTLALNGSLRIATGTVTLPTGTTTISGSFDSTGGSFVHNNSEVRMMGGGVKTITQGGNSFLNHFYDLVFAGNGQWSFTEANATTSRNFRVQNGTVTAPYGSLTVAGDFVVNGTGAFNHNNAQLILPTRASEKIQLGSSALNNVLITSGGASSWYDEAWAYRLPITIGQGRVQDNLANFPVMVDLQNLPTQFFSNVNSDGGDIRVTAGDGLTELPVEIVSIDKVGKKGELYFKADALATSTANTFYIYYKNTSASLYADNAAYGKNNVWSNGFVLATHMADLTTNSVENSKGTPNGTKTSANNPQGVTTGKLYDAQDFSGDAVDFASLLTGDIFSFSGWIKADNLTGSGETATFGYSIFGNSSSNYTWLTAGGTGYTSELRFCAFNSGSTCSAATAGANLAVGNWYHVAVSTTRNGATKILVNGEEKASFIASSAVLNGNFTVGDLRAGRGIQFDGMIDEVRVSNVIRSNAWLNAEFKNTATTTSFYTVGGYEAPSSRIFVDANATLAGDLVLAPGGDATFPSGNLFIGGSLDNNAKFEANGGTAVFNSVAGNETINAGVSSFANLSFNSGTGDFTIIENATATGAVLLADADQFTLDSGKTLAILGSFTNQLNNANTTWTGSTLALLSGTALNLNAKTHAGDTYGTLLTGSSTIAKMWNSSADAYETTGVGSAVYSQDHTGVDGSLNIYGHYVRSTGIEHWSYATDFDGADLTGSERQANVWIASSSKVTLQNASLNMLGDASASSTVNALSGAYSFTTVNSTLNANLFTLSGMDEKGFNFTSSSTLALFNNGLVIVENGQTGISVDTETIDSNPAKQLNGIGFTTAGTAFNVSLTSTTTPNSFIWFKSGFGNLYGEAFDQNDGNPGAIRFDDSSFTVQIAGRVFADNGITKMDASICDGVTPIVKIVVDGGVFTDATSCSSSTGAFSFNSVSYIGDPRIVVYLDTAGGQKGSVLTKTVSNNIANMDIYANQVIVRTESLDDEITIADLAIFDHSNDSDLGFAVDLGSTPTLTTLENTGLYIRENTKFKPNGNLVLAGNGNANSYEGSLTLAAGATLIATGAEGYDLAGSLLVGAGATVQAASSTFNFTATTTGKGITAPAPLSLHNLTFSGVGGSWNISANLLLTGDMEVNAGTVTGTGDIDLETGEMTGDGVVSFGAGTVTLRESNTLAGNTPWSFANLQLGNGLALGTTTPVANSNITVLDTLTIATGHTLAAGNTTLNLAGSGTVLVKNGNFATDSSTVRYSGVNATVAGENYYNLTLDSSSGAGLYTAGGAVLVAGNLTVGGTVPSTFDLDANATDVLVKGNVDIKSSGTLKASETADFIVEGSWANAGALVANDGEVSFVGDGVVTVDAGNSSFASVVIDGLGDFTVSENATATKAWNLVNHNHFTVASGKTLTVLGQFTNTLGGSATSWTGSTLALGGADTFAINDSATSDAYGVLQVLPNTQIRMWNSEADTYTVDNSGSLYSQNHAGVDGELYIWGNLVRNDGADFWATDRDFAGVPLGSGNERPVAVYLAAGTKALWQSGSLAVIGSETEGAITLQNQGTGTYDLTIGGTASTTWNRAIIRNISDQGVVFAGTPTVNNFSFTDHLVTANNGSAITVGGTVINTNQAKNFTENKFEKAGGVTTAYNVTATGTAESSWRFTNHTGNIAGEDFDQDPDGDPGYLVWDDSAALITVSGRVYSDEGSTISAVCDGTTQNIRLVVAGLTTYDASCNAGTGQYSITNVAFSPEDTLTLFINGESQKAVNVSRSPMSSISNLHLYENRVIVRHEGALPLTIEAMSAWDSSADADVLFTTSLGSPNTVTLAANTKLIVWDGKTFAPGGDVTVPVGVWADAGTLEVKAGATLKAESNEEINVGGSFIFGAGAKFEAASSTVVMNSTTGSRTINTGADAFHNLTMAGGSAFAITNPALTLTGSYSQTAGTVDLPTATTTVGASFTVSGGSFDSHNAPLVFNAQSGNHNVQFNNSVVGSLIFKNTATFTMLDQNATSTGSFLVASSTVTLPSGNLVVAGDFQNIAGVINHNTAKLVLTNPTTAILSPNGSDLYAVEFVGGGDYEITEEDIAFLEDFIVNSGQVKMASGTTAVGGSLLATAGVFNHASGTILLNSTTTGRVINVGDSVVNNLQFSAPSGGYTLHSATTTNNLAINSVANLTVNTGATIAVGGVFVNTVGGVATTWANSTLYLFGTAPYSINGRTDNGDIYDTVVLGNNTKIRAWASAVTALNMATSSSLYSQNHAGANGELYIYGNLTIATTTEFWNYSTDFDGTPLSGGSRRQAKVFVAENAQVNITSGALQMVGDTTFPTTIQNQGIGLFTMRATGGSLNANHYSITNLDLNGLQLLNSTIITNLANGYFDITADNGVLITLSSTTLNNNPSKIFDNVGFNAVSPLSGYNINLVGETGSAWRFTNSYGTIAGEDFDLDGIDACGSIRFDNSVCLITEQTSYRWRTDNGYIGVPSDEWFDSDFNKRRRVRINNLDNLVYASTSVKVTIPYDSDMKSDFSDLRFTASDGITEIPFWTEVVVPSTRAEVWVLVPSLPANGQTVVHAYYGNASASSASNGGAVFAAFDGFEDNNISEYSGETTLFTTAVSPVKAGNYSLKPVSPSSKANFGIYRFDQNVSRGQIIRYLQYVDTVAGSGDEPCTLFAVQSPGSTSKNYGVCLEQYGTDRISLVKDVKNNDSSGTMLGSSAVAFTTGWYEVEVDWRTDNTLKVSIFDNTGSLIATFSAIDGTYTTGGYGFSYWFQSGAWDSFTARPRTNQRPTAFVGEEQESYGADWLAGQNVPANIESSDNLRLRIAVENSGLEVENQRYRLEYAPKGEALSCSSVANSEFSAVPVVASCGNSPVCMAASTFVTDGDFTSDLLLGTKGNFTAGRVVANPSNKSAGVDIDQHFYTELEYVLNTTEYAEDDYCFRVTDDGTPLDYYATVAELTLEFYPFFGGVTLNDGQDILLTPGTTTPIYATGTVTDFNGFEDITHATATIYRSGASPSCAPDDNNCYILSTDAGTCSLENCSGSSCDLLCRADVAFYAEPTDFGAYEGEEWMAYLEVEDGNKNYDFASALGVELYTLRALSVDSGINFGVLEPNSDTGSYNPTTIVTNLGNIASAVDVEGSDMTDGLSSSIPASKQKMSTSAFNYASCLGCLQLSTGVPISLGVTLTKPTDFTPVDTEVYWGIEIPFNVNSAPHTGFNTFTAIGI